MLLAALFENSIVVFNSLKEYNKLLSEQNKSKLKLKIYVDNINSIMLQIDNTLSNINFYYFATRAATYLLLGCRREGGGERRKHRQKREGKGSDK